MSRDQVQAFGMGRVKNLVGYQGQVKVLSSYLILNDARREYSMSTTESSNMKCSNACDQRDNSGCDSKKPTCDLLSRTALAACNYHQV